MEETLSTSWLRRTKDKVIDFMRDADPDVCWRWQLALSCFGPHVVLAPLSYHIGNAQVGQNYCNTCTSRFSHVRQHIRGAPPKCPSKNVRTIARFRDVCADIIKEAKENVISSSDSNKSACSNCSIHEKEIARMKKKIQALTNAAEAYGSNAKHDKRPSYAGNRHKHQTSTVQSTNAAGGRQRSPSDASIEGCSSDESGDDDHSSLANSRHDPLSGILSLPGVELDQQASLPPLSELVDKQVRHSVSLSFGLVRLGGSYSFP